MSNFGVVIIVFRRVGGYFVLVMSFVIAAILVLFRTTPWPKNPDLLLSKNDFTYEYKAEDSEGNLHNNMFLSKNDRWEYSVTFDQKITGIRGDFQAAMGWDDPLNLTIIGDMTDGTTKILYQRTVNSGEKGSFDTKIDPQKVRGLQIIADGKFITTGIYWNGMSGENVNGVGKSRRKQSDSVDVKDSGPQSLIALGYWSKSDEVVINSSYSVDVLCENHGISIYSSDYSNDRVHSNVEYLLDGKYTLLEGVLYHPKYTKGKGNGDGGAYQLFEIYGDDQLLYTYKDEVILDAIDFQVDVTNIRILRIEIHGTVNSGSCNGPSLAVGELQIR